VPGTASIRSTSLAFGMTALLAVACAVVSAAPGAAGAAAAGFGAPSPVTGLGAPADAVFLSAAMGADGAALLGGVQGFDANQQAFVAIGAGGAPPARVMPLGPAGHVTSGPTVAVDDAGHGAVLFARGGTVLLSRCAAGRCTAPATVGTSRVLPRPALALQPGTGRVTVLWRGSRGLRWRITTGGRLGPAHAVGEAGDQPQLGTDATGRTIALWIGAAGLRTAARRAGAFTRPATLWPGPVARPRLAVGAGGEAIAAWTAASMGLPTPSAQAYSAIRTAERPSPRRSPSAAPTPARSPSTARPTAAPCSRWTARSTPPTPSRRPRSGRPTARSTCPGRWRTRSACQPPTGRRRRSTTAAR